MPEDAKQKLKCEEIFALLSEYLDQEVAPDVSDCIRAHISGCEPCIDFVESLRRSVELCKHYRSEETPLPLAEEARERLREAYRRMLQLQRGAGAD